MHPVLFSIEIGEAGRTFGSYGAMLCLALVAGTALFLRAAARASQDLGACVAVLGSAVAGGFVGGFSLHGLVMWIHTGSLVQALSTPGLVFFGGAAGAAVAVAIACRLLALRAALLGDLAVPAIAVAHAIGRVGCLLGGCCHGAPYEGSWAVFHLGMWRHPVPLYESAGLLVLATMFGLAGRCRVEGVRIASYLSAYCALRLWLETFRGDAVRGVYLGGGVSTSQLIAACTLTVLAWFMLHRAAWPARSASSP